MLVNDPTTTNLVFISKSILDFRTYLPFFVTIISFVKHWNRTQSSRSSRVTVKSRSVGSPLFFPEVISDSTADIMCCAAIATCSSIKSVIIENSNNTYIVFRHNGAVRPSMFAHCMLSAQMIIYKFKKADLRSILAKFFVGIR